MFGNMDALNFLMDKGADLSVKNANGLTAYS